MTGDGFLETSQDSNQLTATLFRSVSELFRHPMKTRSGLDEMIMSMSLSSSSANLIPTTPFGSNGYGGGQREGVYRGHNNQRSGGYNNYNSQRGQYKHNQNNSNSQYNNNRKPARNNLPKFIPNHV